MKKDQWQKILSNLKMAGILHTQLLGLSPGTLSQGKGKGMATEGQKLGARLHSRGGLSCSWEHGRTLYVTAASLHLQIYHSYPLIQEPESI